MPDGVDATCKTCGLEPSFSCRAHFTRDIRAATERAEAAEKRVAELEAQRNAALNFAAGDNERADEYMARCQRAEAACAQMRDVLVRIFSTTPQTKHVTDMIRPLLATDVGSNWVSPAVHAEVVAQLEYAEGRRLALSQACAEACSTLGCNATEEALVARAVEVVAKLDEMRAENARLRSLLDTYRAAHPPTRP